MNIMSPRPTATPEKLVPDKAQLARFIRTVFRHASSPDDFVSLRAFGREEKEYIIRPFEIDSDDFKSLITGAYYCALHAMKAGYVFSPPVCTFKNRRNAKEVNVAEGLTISVECDSYPRESLATLSALIGPPTLVVASGGRWTNPESDEVEDKLHLHWVLATPASDPESLSKLKKARAYACAIVGADPTNVPVVHPIRWPGSWHLKDPANPRLCHIVGEIGNEIDLHTAYDVLQEAAPAEAIEKASAVKHRTSEPAKPLNQYQQFARDAESTTKRQRVNLDEFTEALMHNPNNFKRDESWNEWTYVGLRIRGTIADREKGLELFDRWSQKSPLYDEKRTAARWREICMFPPDHTGPAKIFATAMANGWTTAPTHAPSTYTDITEARRMIADVIHRFLHPNPYQEFAYQALSSAFAVKCETGIGKTEAAIRAIADFVKITIPKVHTRVSKNGNRHTVTRQVTRRVGFGVATHKLSGEIEQRFADRGVNAATYRGRQQIDPDGDGEALMCLAPEKIKLAIEARQDIEKTCCHRGKDKVCEFYDQCSYQRQKPAIKSADVVIFASDLIFHAQPVIGTIKYLFLDEEYYSKQIANEIEINLSKLRDDPDKELALFAEIMMGQELDGALLLQHAKYVAAPDRLRVRLLNELPEFEFDPGMSAAVMRTYFHRNRKVIDRATLFRNLADMLRDIEAMQINSVEVSGRLFLESSKTGSRILRWQGVRKVTAQFDVPTFIMDATLPPLDILRLTHPRVEQVADIRVAMPPSVRIVQVINAPTSKTKLIAGLHKEKHQRDIVRYILKRWLECGRGKALVISQKEFEDKVLKASLPKEISILHFNALSGVDAFKDVRLAIVIGRTLPKSKDIEGTTGVLTGEKPEWDDGGEADDDVAVDDDDEGDDEKFETLNYERVKRGIGLRDGTGRAVRVNQHPHPLCEALRWQACEAELMQALGRARGINRTDDAPLDIDLLFDEVLPIEVDAVENWERPSLLYEAALRDGVMLKSSIDMQKVWPDLWPNRSAADRVIADGVPDLSGFEQIQYQPKGRNQKWRDAWFDRSVIDDPGAWLESRLGPVNLRAKP